jgi:hypothetical protein
MVDDTIPGNAPNQASGTRDADDIGSDDLDTAADRIEAAVERLARHLDTPRGGGCMMAPSAELAARLDGVIERLRAALSRGGDRAGDRDA